MNRTNYLKRILTFFSFSLALLFQVHAQMDQPAPNVFIYVNEQQHPMNAVTSQTEMKKGWDIQGINVGKKNIRYFSGAHAKQLTAQQPSFAIYPKTEHLNDYVLIRLKEKRDYRRMPAAEFKDCDYQRVEIGNFDIQNLPEMGYKVTPIKPLFPGEYILVDITQKSVNQYGDFKAYDFCVEDK